MAVINKNTTGTDLSALASWGTGSGPLPTSADIAVWTATSNTTSPQTLAGSPTWGAIRTDDLAGPLIIQPLTSNRVLTISGYVDGADTFLFDASSMASGRSLILQSNGAITLTTAFGTSATPGVADVNTGATILVSGKGTGSRPIVKRGGGAFNFSFDNTSTTDFTSPIDLTVGSIAVGFSGTVTANYATGNGTITMSAGTLLQTGNSAAAEIRYFSNPIVVNGNVTLGVGGASAVGTTGFKGTSFDLGSVTRTLTIDGPVRMESAVSGTAGFTKAGAGAITFTNTSSGISGVVTHNGPNNAGRIELVGSSSATNLLPFSGITQYNLNSISGQPVLTYSSTGSGVSYTDDAAFTATVANSAYVNCKVSGTLTLTNTSGGLSGYIGKFGMAVDQTLTATTLVLSEFPTNAFLLTAEVSAGAAGTTGTFRINGGGGASTAGLNANITGTGAGTTLVVFEDNSTAPSSYAGAVTKTGSAQNATFRFAGTNANGVTLSNTISEAAGVLAIQKQGVSRWILSGANTYTGTTTISAGTLVGNSTSAFGTSAGTTSGITQTGGTLEFGAIVNKGTNGVSLVSVAGADAVYSPSGTTGLTCAGVALNTAATIFDIAAGTFTLTNSSAMSGTGFGIRKDGAGEMVLASSVANTYTGATAISAGTLTISSAAAPSVAGPLGNASSGVALTGTIKYTGSGAATISRSMTLTGSAPAFEAAGAGAVTFSAYTHATGARTVTFKGSSTANNTFSAALTNADAGASVVALTKQGASKWILSAAPTYTGLTTVNDGELQFNENNLATSLTINGTGKLSKTVLTGASKTITCDGGTPEIEATTSNNTITGTTAVTAGELRLTTEVSVDSKPAKVLGNTDVTVSANAKLRTTTGLLQRGQARYGGDLTFNGSVGTPAYLYIGG